MTVALGAAGKFSQAEAELDKALSLGPSNTIVLVGSACQAKRRFDPLGELKTCPPLIALRFRWFEAQIRLSAEGRTCAFRGAGSCPPGW